MLELKTPAMTDEPKITHDVAVLGAGPLGFLFSAVLAPRVPALTLWLPETRYADELNRSRVAKYLQGDHRIAENITVTSGTSVFRSRSWILFVVVPSRQLEEIMEKIIHELDPAGQHVIVIITKGLLSHAARKKSTIHTFSEFIQKAAEEKGIGNLSVAALGGPSLLAELNAQMHSFFSVATKDRAAALLVRELLISENIHILITEDIIGLEIGGVLKNPVAIACGIADGLPQSGANLQGVLITRGFREMARFAVTLGARRSTMVGTGGLADLITTCTSPNSRNRSYGQNFVKQLISRENEPGVLDKIEIFLRPATFIEREVRQAEDVVEGAYALANILEIAEEKGLDLPLYKTLFDILSRKQPPDALLTIAAGRPIHQRSSRFVERRKGYALAAGHNFRRLLEKRVQRHIVATKGMQARIKRQSENVLSVLEKRLEKARKKKVRREIESIPREMRLWREYEKSSADVDRERLAELIDFYVAEISDNYNPAVRGTIIHLLAPIRYAASGFRSGGAIPRVGGRVEELRALAGRCNILYTPTHRSHLDSVEVAFGLTWSGLPVPRYAAGINLMSGPFWSWVLKSLGAYAVDRERTRNFLYLECLTRYATMMLEVGIPSLVYPEGTRSRTGGIVPIKTGLLAAAVEAYQASGTEILIVPLAVSYENVPEDMEFAGRTRQLKFSDFIRKRTEVYVDIGEPVRVSRFVDQDDPTATIGRAITASWAKALRVLPNHIIARILVENDGFVKRDDLPGLVEDFTNTRSGNYLTMEGRRIIEEGLSVLRKRGFVEVKNTVRALEPDLLQYYANMAPGGVEF